MEDAPTVDERRAHVLQVQQARALREKAEEEAKAAQLKRRNDGQAVKSARERYLARKREREMKDSSKGGERGTRK